jgi:DNA-binding NtrC family response regulator
MSGIIQKILLVDNEVKFLNSIAKRLKLMGFYPLKASSGQEALSLAKNNPIDLAIVDLKMPGMDGLVTITKLKEIYPDLRSVLLTGYGSEKVKQATEAINGTFFQKDDMHAFWNFIDKSHKRGNTIVITPPSNTADGNTERLHPINVETISDQVSKSDLQNTTPQRVAAITDSSGRLRMIGETHVMQILKRSIERVAALDCTVIFRGETGTGKELAARIIHNSSPRKHHRFIAFNCGCFSNDLIIEELFKQGGKVFSEDLPLDQYDPRNESGGTILLDQIEDMPMKMQLSMLKIIDNKEAFREESTHHFPFDVRILVASRYSLEKLVAEGKFREELYHRLNLMELFIPPLRERRDDILPLSGYFLDKYALDLKKPVKHISDEVISVFMTYDFPGNVRELEHVIERAVILADGKTIETKHLPVRFQTTVTSTSPAADSIMTLADMERNHILKALKATGGNKSKTSELLGISRSALWRKLSNMADK